MNRLITLAWIMMWAVAAHSQCVDSSAVSNFAVRRVTAKVRFALIPTGLQNLLNAHHGESYSADRAAAYEREVSEYLSKDRIQNRYEAVFNRKLKLSAYARLVTLYCVQVVAPPTCTESFSGHDAGPITQCVDVILTVYAMDLDILDTGRYTLPLPRSALATLYAAIPAPLLALNPGLSALQDSATGFMVGIETSTGLLDLRKKASSDSAMKPATITAPVIIAKEPDLEITNTAGLRTDRSAAVASSSAGELPKDPTQLLLGLKASKSVSKSFYDSGARLSLTHLRPLKSLQRLGTEARFNSSQLPQGSADLRRNAALAGVVMEFRPKQGPIQLIRSEGEYRWRHNHLVSKQVQIPEEVTTENGYQGHLAAEGMVGGGLLRVIASSDGGLLDRDQGSYNRAGIRVGYGKEIPLAGKKDYTHDIQVNGERCLVPYAVDPVKSEQTFGVEIQGGAGKAWGTVPEYARFFGGNQFGSFLYDEISPLRELNGPLLRSSKFRQAGVVVSPGPQVGGTAYWHANFNLSIPVPRWSQPLVPHDWVTTALVSEADPEHTRDGRPIGERICVDLRQVLKRAVDVSATSLMIAQLARDKLSDEQKTALTLEGRANLTPEQQAELEAAKNAYEANKASVAPDVKRLFEREILPVTNFIADRANFYAVKPLILFDAGRIMLPGARDDGTRFGAGAGLQIDIVLARFELGYIAALNRIPGDGHGNIFVRFVIKRFF